MIHFFFCKKCNKDYSVVMYPKGPSNCPFCHEGGKNIVNVTRERLSRYKDFGKTVQNRFSGEIPRKT